MNGYMDAMAPGRDFWLQFLEDLTALTVLLLPQSPLLVPYLKDSYPKEMYSPALRLSQKKEGTCGLDRAMTFLRICCGQGGTTVRKW